MKEIVVKIQQSKKYKNIPEPTIVRIVDWASKRSRKRKEIEKIAKNKLHQVYGAYFDQTRLKSINKLIDGLSQGQELKGVCQELLSLHASSKERLLIFEDFYKM